MTPSHEVAPYAQLHCLSNFSFLTGASHPHECVQRAAELGYSAIAITDECSLAGIVKAHVAARDCGIKLLVGSRFRLSNGVQLLALAPHRIAYTELSGFITLARRRAAKGQYEAHWDDLRFRLKHCLIIWLCEPAQAAATEQLDALAQAFKRGFDQRVWLGVDHRWSGGEQAAFAHWQSLSQKFDIPLVAAGAALMHHPARHPLQQALTAIRLNTPLDQLGTQLSANAEACLQPWQQLTQRYPAALLRETQRIAKLCEFSLDELRYQYPRELVPEGLSPIAHLRERVAHGRALRWPQGAPASADALLHKELQLIEELQYEYYFLTVYDLVTYARSRNILCQGRGSAANSVVCYCLFITEIAPGQINVLFERFISKERDEPPDIDVDFEHQRREEVIQYIYQKYGRERAALAATVITYRPRSAIRDLGKALGLPPDVVDHLAKSLAWWDRKRDMQTLIQQLSQRQTTGDATTPQRLTHLFALVQEIQGFPRHLSQHVGGFVIAQDKISDLVPQENASMPERTVIQWDKEDLESMRLLKVDVLALGMLTALRKTLEYVNRYQPGLQTLADIPREDKATYAMLCRADSIGVFQVESRAQMSMLPRLQPRAFYDLVIQIAIIRPGPIQGGMVHPYLRRRHGEEAITYPNPDIAHVLEPTLGIPIFQEQAIRLAMVAAGFSGGEADQLRRAMGSWGKTGQLLQFEQKFIQGMLQKDYDLDFAQRLFEQIKGFGGYGFPESHSASFALLAYASAWFKCHHPAAFYCALLNSQPMGFYSASQLLQDARRHQVPILPVAINHSHYESRLEFLADASQSQDISPHTQPSEPAATDHTSDAAPNWQNPQPQCAIRLGFCVVTSLEENAARQLAEQRGDQPFQSLADLAQRSGLSRENLQALASADALQELSGNRHNSHWHTAALLPGTTLAMPDATPEAPLMTEAPSLSEDMLHDYRSTGLSLRAHPMALLRQHPLFKRCTLQNQLAQLGHGRFVRVAGLVTGRQRPGTAKGTVFLTLEDETGNMNVVVWKATQQQFRQPLLTAKLLLIKGTLEISNSQSATPVIHIVAGHLQDCSDCLADLNIRSRDFH